MKTSFIPIDYDYFDFEGKNHALVIGRDNNDKKICVIDTCDVYLWAILKKNISISKINKIIEKTKKIQINKVFDYSIPHLPVYAKYVKKSEEFPNSLIAGKNNVNLPIYPQLLGKKSQIDHIIESIKDFSKNV